MKSYMTRARKLFKSSSVRLALSYLLIIMIMSTGFSFVFYNTSSHEVGKHVDAPKSLTDTLQHDNGGPKQNSALDNFFQQRAGDVRHELLTRLILINLLIFAGGSLLSYYLARRTLQPIEANMESQSQFVSDASHELRTPLTALQTTNEVAMRNPKVFSAEAIDIFRLNVEEVIKLRKLTDSLLNLAKNDSGSLITKPTELSDIVSDAINAVINSAQGKKIIIDDGVPKISVMADRSSVAQAIVTILDNAIKYSPTGSTVQIAATKQGKFVLLSIKDQGVGIKAVHLPHIFERFFRSDDSRNKHHNEGFGIGLSLAKKIIDQNHGDIKVESTLGEGSIFTVKLPLS